MRVNRRANLKDWANQFRLMREYDGVSKREIKEALNWYSEHIGQEYQPEAYSAKAFREKYKNGQISAAMQRSQRNGAGSNITEMEDRVQGAYLRERPEDCNKLKRDWDQKLLTAIRKKMGAAK